MERELGPGCEVNMGNSLLSIQYFCKHKTALKKSSFSLFFFLKYKEENEVFLRLTLGLGDFF